MSLCGFGLGGGDGAAAVFDAAAEDTAAVSVGAGLVFPVAGMAAGVAVGARSLPPRPNHLPIVCRAGADSVGWAAETDAGV